MLRKFSLGFFVLFLADAPAFAQAAGCDASGAWRQVRQAYPVHAQILAKCQDLGSGKQVIVLTEPAAHLTRSKANEIVRALFSSPVTSVQTMRHQLGYDGWADDLVVEVETKGAAAQAALDEDLALLALFTFGSTYKAEVEDISAMQPAPVWDAPQAVEASAEELASWLLGANAETLARADGGPGLTLRERAAAGETGVYFSSAPGLVVALLPSGRAALNDYAADLRRFAVDTDAFLGAIRISGGRVALVGRERTAPLKAMPPLRVETILLLASHSGPQLAQSYERMRVFAGKLFSESGDLFGWDWAPILLSDKLNDTEFGSLLNFTDNMLKGWSESGKIAYKGFVYPQPSSFPFGGDGAFKRIGGNSLTYNWNTAGVGYISRVGDAEIFSVRNTGSLPVSYFPEGSENDPAAKERLVAAEDGAYKYFSSLRNPLLERAVQYAALYQVFQAFDVTASAPQEEAARAAAMAGVEKVLQSHAEAALDRLASTDSPSTNELLLAQAFMELGDEAKQLEFTRLPQAEQIVGRLREDLASKIRDLDKQVPDWRPRFAELRAKGYPVPEKLKDQLQRLAEVGFDLALPAERVRKAVLAATERTPEAWIRTPSIVVSRGEVRALMGGHNIGGRATRVILDDAIPKGAVTPSGTYEQGRVIRINPADGPSSRDLVRQFDREVGLDDLNMAKGARMVEARLRLAPAAPKPVRPMAAALEHAAGAPGQASRGARPTPRAAQVGYRKSPIAGKIKAEIEALAEQRHGQIVVARVEEGFAILRGQPRPPVTTIAPNRISMLDALDSNVRIVAGGPPPLPHTRILFHSSMGAEHPTLVLQSLGGRAKAASGAGGKPPFGGDRGPFTLVDPPGPGRRPLTLTDAPERAGRHWGEGPPPPKDIKLGFFERSWDSALSLIGKRRARLFYEPGPNARLLELKPNWAEAKIEFPQPGSVTIFNAPEFSFAGQHVVEVTVPVVKTGSGKNLLIHAKTWFKEKLAPAKSKEIDAAVGDIFKKSGSSDAADALTRYKQKMLEIYKGERVWIELSDEAADFIVTEDEPTPQLDFRG